MEPKSTNALNTPLNLSPSYKPKTAHIDAKLNAQMMNQLPNLYVFKLVVQMGSLQSVATFLDLPRSSISKKINQLEQFVGARLLQRTTRQMSLSTAGEQLYAQILSMDELMNSLANSKWQSQTQPQGLLKVSCSSVIGQQHVLPLLPLFKTLYPQIILDLRLEDRLVHIQDEKIDVAIRTGELKDSSLYAKLLGYKSWSWVASAAYLNKKGRPQHPQQLMQHDCLIFENNQVCLNHWQFVDAQQNLTEIQVPASFISNDGRTLIALAKQGQGILMIDEWLIQQELAEGVLQPILSHYKHPEKMPIYTVTPYKQGRSLAVQVFIDFIHKHLSNKLHA